MIPGAQPSFRFNGPAYDAKLDRARLTGQLLDIFALMKDGKWRSLSDIERATGHGQASISAQLRHLRKERFGSHSVERTRAEHGLWLYRLTVNGGTT